MLKECNKNYLDINAMNIMTNGISLLQLKMNMSRKKINIENKQLLFDSTFLTNKSYEFLYSLFLYINYYLPTVIHVDESNNQGCKSI